MIMHGTQIFLWRRRKTVLWIAAFTVIVYAYWVLNSGSITSVLLTNGVLPVLLIPPAMKLVETIVIRLVPRSAARQRAPGTAAPA